jgi:IS5 family transposase
MMETGLFDWQFRFEKLEQTGNPLHTLNKVIDWQSFRPLLNRVHEKQRKSRAGAKPYDVVLMFKIMIIQSLYNLSDDAVEFQILDRISFMRFLGLSLGDRVPDAKTIWLFRERLKQAGLIEQLFEAFDQFLRNSGFAAKKGQIVDASIVSAKTQRNSREENQQIKNGQRPKDWSCAKRRQKDTDASWVKKSGKNYYGYKNHVSIDVKHKLIRNFEVTTASVHDSKVFEQLLDKDNSNKNVYADSAYRSKGAVAKLSAHGFRDCIQRRGCRYLKLTPQQIDGNHRRAKTRARIEHVFGVQAMMAGSLTIRTIGKLRAKTIIGLRNLAYNMFRYRLLVQSP